MSVKMNLGGWSSVFAVPSKVVDDGLKLASAYQLKVLLYILRHSDKKISYKLISKDLSMHLDDVKDSVKYWVDSGLLMFFDDELVPNVNQTSSDDNTKCIEQKSTKSIEIDNTIGIESAAQQVIQQPLPQKNDLPKSKTTRPQKPDSVFVAEMLNTDQILRAMVEEAETIISKPLTPGDAATLVMLNYTFGLPAEVIIMLIQYCRSIDKGNMRHIEKIGIEWSDKGIHSLEEAENLIKKSTEMKAGWNRISRIFGLVNAGSPTQKQLEFAANWKVEKKVPDDLLRAAYERCVDSQGKFILKYIEGILKKWNEQNIRNLDDLENAEKQMSLFKKTENFGVKEKQTINKKSRRLKETSLDLNEWSKKSMFDD